MSKDSPASKAGAGVQSSRWKKGQSGNPKGGKKSAAKKAAEEAVVRALEEGTTPLQIMLEAMRDAYTLGGAKAAMPYAAAAAPYVHPKLSNIDAKVDALVGQYSAQPIPVEQRDSDALAGATGAAAGGDTPRPH